MSRNHRAHYFGADDKPRIEIIPMIDVMMFLLVFFVLIMTEMIQGTGFAVDLPSAERSQALPQAAGRRTLTLAIPAQGPWRLDGEEVDAAQLTGRLKAAAASAGAGAGAPALVIAGDRAVVYQQVVQAMDAARAAGIDAIGLVTQATAP